MKTTLQALYLINKIVKKIRDEIREKKNNLEINLKDLEKLEKLENLKYYIYDFKNEILEKIKNKAIKKEKHILFKQEDYRREYDYFFVVFSYCYYFEINGMQYSYHTNSWKEYYVNEENIEGYQEIGEIKADIDNNKIGKLKNINIKIIIKYLEKKYGIRSYLDEDDFLILDHYRKFGNSGLFDW